MSSADAKRIAYWDNLKGILIVLVVVGHYLWEYRGYRGLREAVFAIYVFHMPAFLFVSGYFSKSERSVGGEALAKLFVWFLALNFSMSFYAYFVQQKSFSLTSLYYSSWYLLALFLYRLTLPWFGKIPFIVPISVITSLCIGFTGAIDDLWQLQKIIALYPFFIVGAKLPSERVERFIGTLKEHMWWGGLVLLAAGSLSLVLIFEDQLRVNHLLWWSYASNTDLARRLALLALATAMILALLALTPRAPVRLLSTWGRNSLALYVTHRIFTLLLVLFYPLLPLEPTGYALLAIACFATLVVLGSDLVARPVTRTLDYLAGIVAPRSLVHNYGARVAAVLAGVAIGVVAALGIGDKAKSYVLSVAHSVSAKQATDPVYPVMSRQQTDAMRNAISVSFVGDLILLRDQVYRGWDPRRGQYDFDPMFEHTRRYLKEADLSIGVFEGPMAGDNVEYSTSSYVDKVPLYLNFPDSFAASVKAAGIKFVTLANNHLLDRGVAGAMRTLDVLDRVGVAHAGSYRSPTDKAERDIPVIAVKGLKIAILTYTFGVNHYPIDYFFNAHHAHETSIIADPTSPYFQASVEGVLNDFKRARAKRPDTIIVLPHWGEQFRHVPDAFQKFWADIFIKAGADVVLGDHPHAVQPIEWRTTGRADKKYALIVYCPGNYVNSYIAADGDAMAIVDAYLDPNTGAPMAASIVPMWAMSSPKGLYRALPVYNLLDDDRLQQEVSLQDFNRIKQVHSLVTSVMLGQDLSLDQVQKRYYFFPEGYARSSVSSIEVPEQLKSNNIYRLLSRARSVTFVGDSVTEGTKNGGYGWYEPLVAAFPHLIVRKHAWGSYTSKMLLDRTEEILDVPTDVYVIAIGTNDVRYRNPKLCAMTSEEYTANLDRLVRAIRAKQPAAQFVFIGAWTTDRYDPISVLDEQARAKLLIEYRQALKSYAAAHGHLYVDPNPGIDKVLRAEYPRDYLKDHIHPNAGAGIRLYSAKVLEASP
ncbi:MAG TPA: CapA family protein [Burkholderiales bacterium]|nr:CapA family protein [Burkholderiales bacterium]